MKWNEFRNNVQEDNFEGQVKTTVQCPVCGRYIYLNTRVILTGYPNKYLYWCTCGWSDAAAIKWTN